MSMAVGDFFAETTRRKIVEAVARAEAQTSAEIVVALRRASSPHRAAALLFGALCAVATLTTMMFLHVPFAPWAFVVDVVIVFVVGAWCARYVPALLRALSPSGERARLVEQAAAATFLARGVHRCKDRNGLLVYISMLEQRVAIVGDVGIDRGTLEHARARANAALEAGDVDAFAAVIEGLGAELEDRHPRRTDDVNELPDDLVSE